MRARQALIYYFFIVSEWRASLDTSCFPFIPTAARSSAKDARSATNDSDCYEGAQRFLPCQPDLNRSHFSEVARNKKRLFPLSGNQNV